MLHQKVQNLIEVTEAEFPRSPDFLQYVMEEFCCSQLGKNSIAATWLVG